MTKLNLFVPMVKYDAERHIGTGMLAEEVTDKSKEIFDYETSKAYFSEWSNAFKKVTNGASAGNLRAMHGNTAAGKFLDVSFDDAAKKIPVSFKVVDPVDQVKCAEGVYTGLSIGGEYVKRWPADENGVVRYTAKPVEGSLVDNPCMYGATFEYIKAAGEAPELRKFVGTKEPEKSAVERGLAYLMKTLSPASLLSIIGATQKAPEVVKAAEPPAPVAPVAADPPVAKDAVAVAAQAETVIAGLKALISQYALMEGDPSAWTLMDLAEALSRVLGCKYTAENEALEEGGTVTVSTVTVEAAAKPTMTKADEPKPIPAPASTDVDAVTKAFETVVKAQTEATAKDLEKRIAKTLGESVEPLKKSIEEIRDAAAKVDERLKKIEKTPAEAGSPIRVVDKTMAPGGAEFAGLDLDTAMKVVDEVTKGGASPAAVNELKLALAARMMPH